MKKGLLSIVFVLISVIIINAQTAGELTVTTTTSDAGGGYAPKNIVAVWIEDDGGNFVKTLLAYAQDRRTHLNTWQASTNNAGTEFNIVDAITGETRLNHDTRTCTWDGTDYNSSLTTDGTYHVWMELTDKNETGNFSSFSFTKGTSPEALTPTDVPSFSSITIDWSPAVSVFEMNNSSEDYVLHPNPTTGTFKIIGKNIREIEIRNVIGSLIMKTDNSYIDLNGQPNGIYLIKITNDNGYITRKLLKQ